MKRSKVSAERYDVRQADLVKILNLGTNQTIQNINASRGVGASGWSLVIDVETVDSVEVTPPTFVEK